ncbi:MAG: DMT family transporter [Candidatus Hodarchaeales archaeon]|jgi:drug/metabolite transporter (DMT)-like permease
MDSEKQKELVVGPAIVAGANALRALDAPVRYPLTLKNNDLVDPTTWIPDPARVPSRSIFIVLVEHLIGTILVVLLLFSRKATSTLKSQIRSFDRRDWISFFLMSAGSGLGLFFFMIAFSHGNPTIAILLQKSQPLITLLFAMVVLQERPTKWFYISLLVAGLGIYLMIFESFGQATTNALLAATFSLVAAIFWGSNTVWGRILTDKVDYWNLTTLRYIGGSAILIVVNLLVGAYNSKNIGVLSETIITFGPDLAIPINGFVAIALVTIFTGGVFPLALYYFGLRWSRASVGGIAELAFPVLAIFVNYIFLGWGLSESQIAGAIILFAVVSLMTYVNKIEHTTTSEA